MSLKSFDKMCERMIMGEPASEKEIYDERQNQIRTRLTVEALWVYIALSGILALTCDAVMWCESVISLMAFSAAVSYLWWVIRNMAKGSLFGVKGNTTVVTAAVMICQGILHVLMNLDEPKEGSSLIVNDGVITDNIVVLVSLAILIITGIVVLSASAARRRKLKSDSED